MLLQVGLTPVIHIFTYSMLIIYQKTLLVILFSLLVLFSCSAQKAITLKPDGYEKRNSVTIENGDIKAVFVDNTELKPGHKPGYNGIAQLYHAKEDSPVFVPDYAGFNLEHVFGGDSLQQLFEPRRHPMTLFRKSDSEVLLYQEATPLSGVESLTEFKVVKPHYIDITFQCVVHNEKFFRHEYAGLFWASYIQHPVDKKIYFKGVTPSDPQRSSWIS